MSQDAPSVGGGVPTGRGQGAQAARPDAEAITAQLIRRALRAAQDHDPLGLQAQLDAAAAALGLARCVDEIVMPVTQELKGSATRSRRDADQVLTATEAVRTWLNQRRSVGPPPADIAPILLSSGPRDRDTVGLESLALLLRYQRCPCRVLGARTSTFTLTIAAQAAAAAGVVIMSTAPRGLPHATDALLAVDALRIPVFFAGTAFEPEHNRQQLPGRYLGTGIEDACTQLIHTLTPALRHRPPLTVQTPTCARPSTDTPAKSRAEPPSNADRSNRTPPRGALRTPRAVGSNMKAPGSTG